MVIGGVELSVGGSRYDDLHLGGQPGCHKDVKSLSTSLDLGVGCHPPHAFVIAIASQGALTKPRNRMELNSAPNSKSVPLQLLSGRW